MSQGSVGEGEVLVGRDGELAFLADRLDRSKNSCGCGVVVLGEPGMGKSRLIVEFARLAAEKGALLLAGGSSQGALEPYLPFKRALEGTGGKGLLSSEEHVLFAQVMAYDSDLNVAYRSGGMEGDSMANVASVVQGFIQESFSRSTEGSGCFEFGDSVLFTERAGPLTIAALLSGEEQPGMRDALKKASAELEVHGDGYEPLSRLSKERFAVRRRLEGARLEGERIRIAERVTAYLESFSKATPLAIVLEDLHWADESTLHLLRYIAGNLKNGRMMLVATARPGEGAGDAVAKLKAEGLVEALDLSRMDSGGVASLVGSVCGATKFPPDFLARLGERCGGNPLFILELARQMVADGSIGVRDGACALRDGDLAIPASLDDVISARLAMLGKDELALAEYLSCEGREFSIDLARVAPNVSDCEDAMAKLVAQGFISIHQDRSYFTHALFQNAVYSGITPRWKSAHHKSLGEHCERLHADNLDEALYELARHFSNSNDHAKAHDYCSRAGTRAESEYAPLQALELYGKALGALGKMEKSEGEAAAALMEKIGDILSLLGKYDDALASYGRAGPILSRRLDKARVLRKVGDVRSKKGDYPIALDVFSEAMGLVGEDRGFEYGQIRLSEGDILIKLGERAKAMELLEEARAVFANVKTDQRGVSNAFKHIGTLHFRLRNLDEAMRYQKLSLEIAESVGDLAGMSNALNNIALVHFERGEFDPAIAILNESVQIREKTGDISTLPNTLSNMGIACYLKGDYDLALDYHRRALSLKERFGQKWGIGNSYLSMGVVLLARGELDLANEMYAKCRVVWEGIGDKQNLISVLNNIGEIHILKGEFAKALEIYSQSLSIAENINETRSASSAACGLAQAHLDAGDLDGALNNAMKSLDLAVKVKSKSNEGKARLALGAVLARMNETKKSEEMLVQGVGLMESSDNKGDAAYAYYEYGVFLKSIGRVAEAENFLKNGLELFESRGMKLWMKKTVMALDDLPQ